jgi:glycine cleavage system H protein
VQIPDELRYAENHEWARALEDGTVRVGITDFAQDALGDIVFVELPDVGTTLSGGDAFGEVESTKSVSDVYAPLSGEVVARNEALIDTPELVNSDPYGDGWFIVLEPADDATLSHLMDAAAYADYTAE